jgi:aminopeptidase
MKYLDKYAELLLEAGVALQAGQNLVIHSEPVHAGFAFLLERMAYQKGARLVSVELLSPLSRLNRANYSRKEFLNYLPAFWEKKLQSYVEEEWALLYIGGMEDMQALKDLDQANYSVIHKAFMPLMKDLITARSSGSCTWTIANMPTAAWARSIWPEEAENMTNEALTARLWEAMIPILRLDQDDPVTAWRLNSQMIHRRASVLNQLDLDHFHFEGPGTDLQVYLTPHSAFIGGSQPGKLGQEYSPNLPTEEFFTTPDYRKTQGTARVTRPVNVLGVNVYGAWFTFKDGAVVDYGAEKNKDRLDAFFKLDDKARYLGEVALVDCNSPIFRSELVFNDILFDENAACHIALGRGISMALPEKKGLSAEELDELGCNNSTLHTDFMIGSEKLNVHAMLKSGGRQPVIESGLFVI